MASGLLVVFAVRFIRVELAQCMGGKSGAENSSLLFADECGVTKDMETAEKTLEKDFIDYTQDIEAAAATKCLEVSPYCAQVVKEPWPDLGHVVTVTPPGLRGWLWYWAWRLVRFVP
jgi:hypothetical protein